MSRIGPSGVDRGVRTGIRYAGRPDLSDYLLDKGIRHESNTCSGDPGEVAEGEVNTHLGNPGLSLFGRSARICLGTDRMRRSIGSVGVLLG
ncbi:MAG TPA: hypothetical protein VN648_29350, partial [Candidatus Methylomirabilis sp.]|nr:hypothetical protein [Candidatus Methylomirabilis sp.]